MSAAFRRSNIAPEHIRFMLLAYGLEHSFRVVSIDEIAQEIAHVKREEIRGELDRLAEEGLVTRFSGRFCFNRVIPESVRRIIEQSVTTSGTIRARNRV
jgi:RIO-like serine/threonine protein kinase